MNLQQTQQPMKQPPNIISGKDHYYIEDLLNWNLTLAKQAKHFYMEATDQDVKNALLSLHEMHQRHYQKLLQLLQNNNNQ
ncbi:MAG TPA: spore coat protein [Haloplasmataceae bacterium]